MNYSAYTDASVTFMVELVNTYDVCGDPSEKLAAVPALESFLRAHNLLGDGGRATKRDLDRIRALRGRVRQVLDAPDESDMLDRLNEVLSGSGAAPRIALRPDGSRELRFAPSDAPLAQRAACDAAVGLATMLVDHPDRLKTCTAAPCRDVFVDQSRNRCRRYCSDTCGSRATVAAYRERQRQSGH